MVVKTINIFDWPLTVQNVFQPSYLKNNDHWKWSFTTFKNNFLLKCPVAIIITQKIDSILFCVTVKSVFAFLMRAQPAGLSHTPTECNQRLVGLEKTEQRFGEKSFRTKTRSSFATDRVPSTPFVQYSELSLSSACITVPIHPTGGCMHA